MPETIMPVASPVAAAGRSSEEYVSPGNKRPPGERDPFFTSAPFEGLAFHLNSSQDPVKLTVCCDVFFGEGRICLPKYGAHAEMDLSALETIPSNSA
ncbi:hypothetical protein [Roseibium sp. Sym1]|uniref:hypothetical protein n=1 Tax=Roseibium sp. Sym1 TaxID=3016006 RepID=UPI0022B4452C|nr:hypothetical protein [Roseibium sp. Sym1]